VITAVKLNIRQYVTVLLIRQYMTAFKSSRTREREKEREH